MSKNAVARPFALWLLSSLCLSSASLSQGESATGKPGAALATHSRFDMVTGLKAMSPHSSLGDQAKVFDRLVGTWDVEYADFSKDGKVTHRSGEFIVGWVMDGRAIQDVWIVYPPGARKDREVYTDLRYYDPKSQTWRATFIDPEHVSVARFTGSAVGDDRIVLDTQAFDGTDTRWSFNDIRSDSFVFRDQASSDASKT